jgi:hypothetical protein
LGIAFAPGPKGPGAAARQICLKWLSEASIVFRGMTGGGYEVVEGADRNLVNGAGGIVFV